MSKMLTRMCCWRDTPDENWGLGTDTQALFFAALRGDSGLISLLLSPSLLSVHTWPQFGLRQSAGSQSLIFFSLSLNQDPNLTLTSTGEMPSMHG
jgi:hypothetical protein